MSFSVGAIIGELALKDEWSGTLKKGVDSTKDGIKGLNLALGAISGAILGAGTALLGLAAHTAEYRDTQAETANSVGLAVDKYVELTFAAKNAGVGQEQFNKALKELLNPGKEAQAAIAELGVSLTDSAGNMKEPDALLNDLADKFEKIENPAERATKAMKIFGDRGAAMVNVLGMGSAGIGELTQKARDLGIVFNENAAKQAGEFDDALTNLTAATGGLSHSVGGLVIEFINQTGVMDKLALTIGKVTNFLNNLDDETKETIFTVAKVTLVVAGLTLAFVSLNAIIPIVGAALKAAFITNPIGAILTGIIIAITGIIIAFQKIPKILTEWSGSMGQVALIVASIIAPMFAIAGAIGVIVKHWDAVKIALGPIMPLFQKIADLAKRFVDFFIVGQFRTIIELLGRVFGASDFMGSDKINLVQKALLTILSVTVSIGVYAVRIKNVFMDLGSAIKTIATALHSMFVEQEWKKGAEQISQTFLKLHDNVTNAFKGTSKEVADEIAAQAKGINDHFKKNPVEIEIEIVAKPGPGGDGPPAAKTWLENFADALGQGIPATIGFFVGEFAKSFMGVSKKTAVALATAVSNVVTSAVALTVTIAEAALNRMQNRISKITGVFDIFSTIQRANADREVADLEKTENEKLDILRTSQIQKLALIDEEFRRKKELLDLDFSNLVETERMKFEAELEILNEKAADEEQRKINEAVMQEDFQKYLELLEKNHEDNLLNITSNSNTLKEAEQRKTGEEIAKAEQEKQNKINAAQEAQQKSEKKRDKEFGLFKYTLDVAALEITKQMQVAQANMAFAATVAAAGQAWAAMSAAFPGPGFAIGAAMFGTLSAIALVQRSIALETIRQQIIIPPASLFAADGGTLGGNLHSQGGVNVNAERGETILSRSLTNRMDSFISEQDKMGGTTVNFGTGAIIVQGNMDDSAVEKVAVAVARKIEQRRF